MLSTAKRQILLHKQDHFFIDCPLRNVPRDGYVCFNCGNSGHFRHFCPFPPAGGAGHAPTGDLQTQGTGMAPPPPETSLQQLLHPTQQQQQQQQHQVAQTFPPTFSGSSRRRLGKKGTGVKRQVGVSFECILPIFLSVFLMFFLIAAGGVFFYVYSNASYFLSLFNF